VSVDSNQYELGVLAQTVIPKESLRFKDDMTDSSTLIMTLYYLTKIEQDIIMSTCHLMRQVDILRYSETSCLTF